jgi:hypothetical protein
MLWIIDVREGNTIDTAVICALSYLGRDAAVTSSLQRVKLHTRSAAC